MKFSDSVGIKSIQWEADEQVVNSDVNFIREMAYKNLIDTLAAFVHPSPVIGSEPDIILGEGLYMIWSAAMTAYLHPGIALSFTGSYFNSGSWYFTAANGFVFGAVVPIPVAVSVSVGDSTYDRYDTVEIRPAWNDYDAETRWFQDPISGAQSQASVDTKVNFGYEVQVVEGTPSSSPAAPAHTAGWIKVAEVFVPQNATALTQDNYVSAVEDNSDWTTEPTVTSRKRWDTRSLTGWPGYTKGYISGGLDVISGALKIVPGEYEVEDGTLVQVTSLSTVSSFFGAVMDKAWHYVLMNKAGTIRGVIAKGNTIGKTYSIQSITGGNTVAITAVSGGVQPVAGMIAKIINTTSGGSEGFFKITSVSGSPVDTVVIDGVSTNQAAPGGTLYVYYPMSTYHFGIAGARVDIAADSDVSMYSPSPTDSNFLANNFDSDAEFNLTRNGYYCTFDGVNDYTGYRIIGAAYRNASGVWSHVISYKSGRDKNDNVLQCANVAVTTKTAGNYYYGHTAASFTKMWGNDYLLTDDATNGFKMTLLANLEVQFFSNVRATLQASGLGDNAYATLGITVNDVVVTSLYYFQHALGALSNYPDTRTSPLILNTRLTKSDYINIQLVNSYDTNESAMYAPQCVMRRN